MQTLEIEICNPKAEQLLYDLARLDLIVIHFGQDDMEHSLRRKAGWAKGTFAIPLLSDKPLDGQRPPCRLR